MAPRGIALSENLQQTDTICKHIFPLSTLFLGLLFIPACWIASLAFFAFACVQEENGAFLVQVIMFLTLISWPIVIFFVITESRRLYKNKIYRKALYVQLYALSNILIYGGLNILSSFLFGECEDRYVKVIMSTTNVMNTLESWI